MSDTATPDPEAKAEKPAAPAKASKPANPRVGETPARRAAEEAGGTIDANGVWQPTPESKHQATTLREWAVVLWVLGIVAEAVGIFWVLGSHSPFNIAATHTVNDDGTVSVTSAGFSTAGVWVLIAFLVFDAIVVIIANQLWKKANHLDPASKKEAFRFFVQNQLGAIIAVIAFVPIIILIFTNKNMSGSQKAIAGIVGIVLAGAAVWSGVDVHPASKEQYSADQTAVIQILGKDQAFWTANGSVYHPCENVSDLKGSTILSGTTADAVAAGKERLSLKLKSELQQCGLPVPANIDAITAALQRIQGGETNTVLPAPDWTGVSNAPQVDWSQIAEQATAAQPEPEPANT